MHRNSAVYLPLKQIEGSIRPKHASVKSHHVCTTYTLKKYNSKYAAEDERVAKIEKESTRDCPGCVFFFIVLIFVFKITLLVTILLWRFFDIDIFPASDQRENAEIFNITDYIYNHKHLNNKPNRGSRLNP